MTTLSNSNAKSAVAPERTLNQRMDALQKANVIRSQRAALKKDL